MRKITKFAACLAAPLLFIGALIAWQHASAYPVGDCPVDTPDGLTKLLPDSHNCSIYYVCMSGVPFKVKCPAGLHFNPNINVCEWPGDFCEDKIDGPTEEVSCFGAISVGLSGIGVMYCGNCEIVPHSVGDYSSVGTCRQSI